MVDNIYLYIGYVKVIIKILEVSEIRGKVLF
jgi:hypothetical protein